MEASMTNAQDERGKPTSRVATTDVLASPRTDYDIELAREAQAQFLSRKFPDLKTLSYAGICVRAGGVGGDYCDFLSPPYQCFRLVVGDIAGKSVAAELQMANLQATLRSLGGTPFILRSDNMIKRLESGGRVLGLIADRSHAESQAGP
jgi:serine phosphatase RsbU (regulator of sigma subunit)